MKSIAEILTDASKRFKRLPKWRRDQIEAERRRDDEVSQCSWCLDSYPRRSKHWEWCAYRG